MPQGISAVRPTNGLYLLPLYSDNVSTYMLQIPHMIKIIVMMIKCYSSSN